MSAFEKKHLADVTKSTVEVEGKQKPGRRELFTVAYSKNARENQDNIRRPKNASIFKYNTLAEQNGGLEPMPTKKSMWFL